MGKVVLSFVRTIFINIVGKIMSMYSLKFVWKARR